MSRTSERHRGIRLPTAGHLLRVLGLGAALLFVAAGCGDDSDEGDAGDESAAESSETTAADDSATEDATTSTADPDEAEVLEAFETAVNAMEAANDPPDPRHPDLLATHEGDALTGVQDGLEQRATDGVTYVVTSETSPTVENLEGDSATIRDCYREEIQEVDTETGEEQGDPVENVGYAEVEMERMDGVWKIIDANELEESCTPE